MLKSSNYAQIKCTNCNTVFHIMPDEEFEKVECLCDSYTDLPLSDLRKLAKSKNIKSAMQMGRETLLKKLKEL